MLADLEQLARSARVDLTGNDHPVERPPDLPGLTGREREVLGYLLAGGTNAEIAKALVLSQKRPTGSNSPSWPAGGRAANLKSTAARSEEPLPMWTARAERQRGVIPTRRIPMSVRHAIYALVLALATTLALATAADASIRPEKPGSAATVSCR